jgi:hypothetical protein
MDLTGFNNDMFYQFYLNQIKNRKMQKKKQNKRSPAVWDRALEK